MIEPALSDDAFLADVAAARSAASGDALYLWWLGQSGFLVQWQGRHLLLDPYLSDSLTHKYAATQRPHVRMTRRVIDPVRLDFIDIVAATHQHTDHLDGETLRPLLAANPDLIVVVPAAHRALAAERLQIPPERLATIDAGISYSVRGFTLRAIPAAHETIERDGNGHTLCLGYVVECGPWKIYHSGDTVLYDGLAESLQGQGIDVALLPINGRNLTRGVAGNLWGHEAAGLAHAIGAQLLIPCHFEMFEFNTATPNEVVTESASLGVRCRVLRSGERWESRELA